MNFFVKRNWLAISIDMELRTLEKYMNEMEKFIINQLHELDAQYDKRRKRCSSEEATHIFESYYENQFYYYENEFPYILRKSFIISLYSFLEQKSMEICKISEYNNRRILPLDSIESKGIFKYYKYLNEVVNIDSTILKKEWSQIIKINKIRNHFVHDGNILLDKILKPKNKEDYQTNNTVHAFIHFNLAAEDKQFTKLLKPQGKLKYSTQISDEFCQEALNIIKAFFEKLTCSIEA
ncbi:TPA: hypothetical protein ACLQU7_001009 [Bacillus tropicus]|uniref:hypothetical protein n=1 Tax=Bacillus tropicus TaxID=2026188 RepID=UPI00003CB474|nr:hypothetical protein [Bacillus tropicus]AIY76336.1 hypothetical protein NT98_4578 [Bacillus cereus]AJI04153.1 hypothetical protein AQ16_1526 [Bacillus cereus G9241]EAL16595.1 hypothetical protein protein [Bacillus cereus G9241]QPS52506.1 hypothetical protein I6G54_10835 [Bacillus tropicus]